MRNVTGFDRVAVAVRADQQNVSRVRVGDEAFDELQRSGVGPVQIVQKKNERMIGVGETPHEAAKDRVKPVLRFGGGQLQRFFLRADDQFDIRNDVGDDRSVGPQNFAQASPPALHGLLGLR